MDLVLGGTRLKMGTEGSRRGPDSLGAHAAESYGVRFRGHRVETVALLATHLFKKLIAFKLCRERRPAVTPGIELILHPT